MNKVVKSETNCRLCPRRCGADRLSGIKGRCGEDTHLRIASASIHRGEEPPITGAGGSGVVFVTGCGLGCVFCQNHQISQGGMGRPVSIDEFAEICLALERQGAENVNIVTGSHAVPAIVEGVAAARKSGLTVPIVWNTSAYESEEALALLKDTVDVYLPDLKTMDAGLAGRLFNAPDYPERASAAIKKMIEYQGELRFGESREPGATAPLVKGVIIRHMALPGFMDSTLGFFRWFIKNAKGRAMLSLLTQYSPRPGVEPSRPINAVENKRLLRWLDDFDIDNGFCQEWEAAPSRDWLPDFSRPNPFPSSLSKPVWHWKEGFCR